MLKHKIFLTFLIFAVCITSGFADRAHEIAKTAGLFAKLNMPDSPAIKSYKEYALSAGVTPVIPDDLYLNFLKNQSTLPDFEPGKFLTQDDFKMLNSSIPAGMNSKNHYEFSGSLADKGEGNICGIVGYVYYVGAVPADLITEDEHTGRQYVLIIGVGFDEAIAKEIQGGHSPSESVLRQKSVIVEMTPKFRVTSTPQWTVPLLNAMLGRPVKVVGQLILDNTDFRGQNTSTGAQFSYWKFMPVTRFYICKSNTVCPPDSPEWKKIEEIMNE